MFWLPILSLLVMWFAGSDSQPVLTQTPSASVSSGSTVKLPCVMGTGFSISSYVIAWYQQKPGNPPRYLLYYHSDSSKGQGSGIPSRFSGSKDTSANTGYLTITGVLPEDEADYYCGTYRSGSNYVRIFGGGTQLTVSGGPRSPPTVNLYCPPKEQMASEGKATLVCSITDFSPSPMETTWEVGGTAVSNGVQTTKPIKDNGKYMTSSYMTTTASDWERGDSFTCKVRHEGIDYVKTVSQSQCP